MAVWTFRVCCIAFVTLFLPFFTQDGACEVRVRGTLSSLRALSSDTPVYISVETPYGLEQFELQLDNESPGTISARHLNGTTRERRGRHSPSAVAATRMGDTVLLFFTSSRHAVPSSVSFKLTQVDEALRATNVRYSRALAHTLPCGSGTGHQMSRARHGLAEASAGPLGDRDLAPFSPPRVLEITTRADYDFYMKHGSDTNDYIRAVLYAAEVLYARSLGVRFKIVEQGVVTGGSPSNGVPVEAAILLEAFRQALKRERGRSDVYHLFTGRELAGRTIGIAYVKSACSGGYRFNVGLSRDFSPAMQPMLAAHEIGHNLGAYHDDEVNSVMNPVISPSMDHFSYSAISQMKTAILRGMSCLSRMPYHQAQLSLDGTNEETFSASVSLASGVAESCTATLYVRGMSQGKPYGPLLRLASQQITSQAGYSGMSFAFSAPRPSAPAEEGQALFQVKVACRSQAVLSNTQVLTIAPGPSASSNLTTPREWILALAKSFFGRS